MEVKTPEGTVTENQANFLNKFSNSKGYAFVVRSLEDAMNNFKTIGEYHEN